LIDWFISCFCRIFRFYREFAVPKAFLGLKNKLISTKNCRTRKQGISASKSEKSCNRLTFKSAFTQYVGSTCS